MIAARYLAARYSACARGLGGPASRGSYRALRTSSNASAASRSPAPATSAPPPAHEDGMLRYPGVSCARGGLRLLDYGGTLAFASSGAAAAAVSGMDAFGAVVVGTVTAVGGGTIRDAVILRKIPFWTEEVEYLYLSIAAAGATFWLWPRHETDGKPRDYAAMQWADAFGVGAFATIGAQNAIRAGMPALVTVLCGISTATFGGAVRDVTLNRPIRILHSHAELYASTAAAGASAYMVTRALGGPVALRILAGVSTSVAARYVSWTYGVRLPTWSFTAEEDGEYAKPNAIALPEDPVEEPVLTHS